MKGVLELEFAEGLGVNIEHFFHLLQLFLLLPIVLH